MGTPYTQSNNKFTLNLSLIMLQIDNDMCLGYFNEHM